MEALPHQVEAAEKGYSILKELGYVYISGMPRTGKTFISILIAELCNNVENVLVLTKKQAIPGWLKFIDSTLKKNYMVINYEKLGKINGKAIYLAQHPDDYQLVIIDESHNIGAFPKPSNRWRLLKAFCKSKPHIHLSGTPIIESPNAIYHQMAISDFTPFRHKNFYDFFKQYGIPSCTYIRGQQIQNYTKAKPELLDYINSFTIYITQQQAGIEVPVLDKLHYVELPKELKKLYNTLMTKRVLDEYNLVCDSVLKLRINLHMLESGIIKGFDKTYILDNMLDKIMYVKHNFGDTPGLGIMAHYTAEQNLLRFYFKNAKIYSSNAHAEGVDLSHLTHFVIFSSDYSGAKFVQRRERIANINGSNTSIVHHILVKDAISDQVYKAVSKKRDFNNNLFETTLLS